MSTTYTYAYKTSDGMRHEAAMEAASREAVFEALRAQGIRAIKVVAADGSKANGEVRVARRRVAVFGTAILALCALAGMIAVLTITPLTNYQPTNLPTTTARPLPRQMIPGDRSRLAAAVQSLTNAAERLLASFAEPGRPLPNEFSLLIKSENRATNPLPVLIKSEKVTEDDFRLALATPIKIRSDEFTESIDLKRIVTGIKSEMRAYLAGGGTIPQYLAECVRRQQQEIAYRARAESRLAELLQEGGAGGRARSMTLPRPGGTTHQLPTTQLPAPQPTNYLSTAYAYWLKANAQLNAMGVYPLPLPDALRAYQMSVDIEE